MRFATLFLLTFCLASTSSSSTLAQSPTTQPASEIERLEREVMDNLRAQPIGKGTVDDLNLPEEFRRRVADRALRVSYEQRFRIVVPDAAGSSGTTTAPAVTPSNPLPTKPARPPSGRVIWSSGGLIAILIAAMAARRRRRRNP